MSTMPAHCGDITVGWLNQVLGDEIRGGAAITSVDIETIGAGVGFIGELARLHLQYDRPVDAPKSIIAKMPTLNPQWRHIGMLYGFYEKESRFYELIAPSVDVPLAVAYHNDARPDSGEYILLLEDLGDMRAGDQLAPISDAEIVDILGHLAGLHAAWWNDPKLVEFAAWLPGVGSPFFEIVKGAFFDQASRYPWDKEHLVPSWVGDMVNLVMENYDEFLAAMIGNGAETFVHGDFRIDNMMFGTPGSSRDFALLDFQISMRGNPMADVVYFLSGSLPIEQRRGNERGFVRAYHDALLAAGVDGYSFERCWEDYVAASPLLLNYLVAVGDTDFSLVPERGRILAEEFLRRYAAAMDDLGALQHLMSI
jgi:Ecdysteroid kinase-like family